MILGLSGAKGSGKDTVAAYLVKEHGFERKAFADPMKKSVAALFDIPFSEVDKLKNDELNIVRLWTAFGACHDMTFRTFLQRYGTESHRDVFGESFWLDYTLPVQGFYPGREIVVSDVRFKNEADRIRTLGGYVITIHRESVVSDENPHRSEQIEFVADFEVQNNGTLEELFARTDDILVRLGQAVYS